MSDPIDLDAHRKPAVGVGVATPQMTLEQSAEALRMLDFRDKLRDAVKSATGSPSIDTGFGLGSMDFWFTYQGEDFYMTVQRKDRHVAEPQRP